MQWEESDEEYSERHFRHFCERHGLNWQDNAFRVSAADMERVYTNAVNAFNASCERLEREDTEMKVRQLLGAVLGHHTREVPEPIDRQNSGCLPKDWA